jgi:hypothetical protein
VTGDAYQNGNLIPGANKSCGLTGSRWEYGYFNNVAIDTSLSVVDEKVTSNLIPSTNGDKSLGATAKRWDGWFDELNVTTLQNGGSTGITVHDDLIPNVTSHSQNLGGVSNYWGVAYLTTANIGTLQNGGSDITVHDNLIPNVAAHSQTLGDTSHYWSHVWATEGFLTRVTTGTLANAGNPILVSDALSPDEGHALGTSGIRFGTCWFTTANIAILQNNSSAISLSDSLVPDSVGALDLGSTDYTMGTIWAATSNVKQVWPSVNLQSTNGSIPANQKRFKLGSGLDGLGGGYCGILVVNDAGVVVSSPFLINLDSGIGEWTTVHALSYLSITGPLTHFLATDVYPFYDNYTLLGNSTEAWEAVYAHAFYCNGSHYNTYDDYDDLELVDQYSPSGEYVNVRKVGEEKRVSVGDPKTRPWPMMDESGGFTNISSSFDFLLGAIKQLHAKVKKQAEEIANLKSVPELAQ